MPLRSAAGADLKPGPPDRLFRPCRPPGAPGARGPPGVLPQDGDGAAAAAAQALKDLDDGGLAGAVGSQEGQNGAGRDGEIQVLKDALVPVGLGQATDLDGGELRHTISV